MVLKTLATVIGLFTAIMVPSIMAEQMKDDYINGNRKQIVRLTNYEQTSGGTGFFVRAPSGQVYTMTNAHVCGLGAQTGTLFDDQHNELAILAVYPDHDLCILDTPGNVDALNVAKSVRLGEDVYVLGHPLLEPTTLVKGQISGNLSIEILQGFDVPCEGRGYKKEALDPFSQMLYGAQYACVRALDSVKVTANILPGNSGSPVLNLHGNVVGVAFAGVNGSAQGYIVPLSEVKAFLEGK